MRTNSGPGALRSWAVDGGSARITVAARAVREPAQPLGQITLAPQTLDGITQPVAVALVAIPSSGLVTAQERRRASSRAPSPAACWATPRAAFLRRNRNVFGSPAAGRGDAQTVTLEALPAATGEIALSLAENDSAIIPQAAAPAGRMRVWRAESTFGQPGLDAGRRMGVADGSALALPARERLRIWNADGNEALRLRVATIDLETRPASRRTPSSPVVLPPRTAQPVALRPGAKKIEINLVAGAAALLDGGEPKPSRCGAATTPSRARSKATGPAWCCSTPRTSRRRSRSRLAPAQGDSHARGRSR